MTLVELQRLAGRLGLTDALNLDGGGSTTMVVAGHVVNQPSAPTGARTVSDVLLVLPRPSHPDARPR
jgi:exopolysaccharide biosynthesis protein